MLSAFRREPVDRIPWVPRLDLWFKSNQARGTLPPEWRDASLRDIVRDLGVGFHAAIPDFLDTEHPDEACDRVLGLDHVPNQPYRLRFRRTRREVIREGETIRVIYHTPAGDLSGVLLYTAQMRRDGVTLMHVHERVVKSPEDYRVLAALFEDIEIESDQSRYRRFRGSIGEDGVAVAFGNVAASPVHHLLKELVPYDRFYYDLHDRPDLILNCAKVMQPHFDAALHACCESDAELVMFGANYDVSMTPPWLFEEHILPELRRWADALHAHGKLLATHTDGENQGLCHLYSQAGVDVADSSLPASHDAAVSRGQPHADGQLSGGLGRHLLGERPDRQLHRRPVRGSYQLGARCLPRRPRDRLQHRRHHASGCKFGPHPAHRGSHRRATTHAR